MAISANNISNVFLKTYLSQINTENGNAITSSSSIAEQEKLVQEFAFQMVLQQMMDSMDNSMMSDFVGAAIGGDNSYDVSNSLNLMGMFNSGMRSANNHQSGLASKSENIYSDFNMLGIASSKYESNLNPGAISNNPGDYGGKSYGAWQFSSKTGSLNSFINWLEVNNNDYYNKLSQAKLKDGNSFGENFDNVWKEITKGNNDKFLKAQQQYIVQAYYDKAAESLKAKYDFNISTKSNALKESLWSTVVQHGVGGTLSIFSKLNLNNSDREIINDLYNERQKVNIYFKSSSEQVKQSIYNRFIKEKADMLDMLNKEVIL